MIVTATQEFTSISDGNALVALLHREGRIDEARALADKMLPESCGDERVAVLLNRAMVERADGNHRLSLAILKRLETENPLLKGNLHHGLAVSYWNLGCFDSCLIEYCGATECYRQAGHGFYEARTEINIGNVLVDLNQPDKAHEHLDRAIKVLTEESSIAQLHHTRARAYQKQGNKSEALHYAALSVSILARLELPALMKESQELLMGLCHV